MSLLQYIQLTRQLIVGEDKSLQLGELPNFLWNGACERMFKHKLVSGGVALSISIKAYPLGHVAYVFLFDL